VIHSQKERRYRCKRCSKTFSETIGTALYRVHKPHELVTIVVTLLAYGCPVQAIVAGFGLDERTVARWQRERADTNDAGASTNTSSRPEGCSWHRSRPTSCVSASLVASLVAGLGDLGY
jgi:transposase-like protein